MQWKPPQLKPLQFWLNLEYAAALYGIAQLQLAGGEPHDSWWIAQWCARNDASGVAATPEMLRDLWLDTTGCTL
jgi:hypothetical protein